MDLQKEIQELVAQIIQIPAEEITPEASFFDVYGMDSLKALEILAEVENRYHITIDPDAFMQMTCLKEVVRITEEALQKNG